MFIDVNGKTLHEGDEVILFPLFETERLKLPPYVGTIRYEGNKAWVGDTEVYLYDKLVLKQRKNGNTA